jgi:hypothetical protein
MSGRKSSKGSTDETTIEGDSFQLMWQSILVLRHSLECNWQSKHQIILPGFEAEFEEDHGADGSSTSGNLTSLMTNGRDFLYFRQWLEHRSSSWQQISNNLKHSTDSAFICFDAVRVYSPANLNNLQCSRCSSSFYFQKAEIELESWQG